MMRRSLAVFVALLLGVAPGAAYAQGGFSIKGGLSYGNVSNSGLLPGQLNHRTGFAAGISLTPMTRSLVGFGIEALYAQRGVESDVGGDSRKLNYVDLPVFLMAAIPTPGAAPYVYAGPQFSLELKCHDGIGDCPDGDRPKTSYAAVFGAGVRIGGPAAISLEGRYLYGLTDLKLGTVTSSASYKTRSFLLLAGFAF